MTHSFAFTLLLSLPLCAADQVVLNNGDTITGTIVKKDGPRLVIKSEFLGEVSMPWTAIKSVHADSELFVQIKDKEIVKGQIEADVSQIKVISAAGTTTALAADVTAIRDAGTEHAYERLLRPRILDLWTGSMDIGLALARGNARTDTLTSAFNAVRATRTDLISLYANTIYGTARVNNVSSTIASSVRAGWKYNRNLTPRFFVSLTNDYEHDRFQNLDFRYVAGAGAGWKAVKRENLTLDVAAGGDWDRENFMDGLHRNFAEGNYGDNLLYKVNRITTVTQAFRMFHNISERGAYRFAFDLGTATTLRRWLSWQVTASDRYQSNPVLGAQRNDLLMSTGFRLTFVR
jgi:putative salt-induced outer membrane protein YdiY